MQFACVPERERKIKNNLSTRIDIFRAISRATICNFSVFVLFGHSRNSYRVASAKHGSTFKGTCLEMRTEGTEDMNSSEKQNIF